MHQNRTRVFLIQKIIYYALNFVTIFSLAINCEAKTFKLFQMVLTFSNNF